MVVVGLREQGPAQISEAAEDRVRAYTLFVKSYDAIRRAVHYLRWNEGDGDRIAPSLYAGRGGRRKVEADVPAVAEAVEAVTPAARRHGTPAGSPVAVSGNSPSVNAAQVGAPSAGDAPAGGNPFVA